MIGIDELMLGQISKSSFLDINSIVDITDVVERKLVEAYQSKNAEAVDELLYLVSLYEIYNGRIVGILNELLVCDWHFKHEDIVLLLEKMSAFESLRYIYDAIELKPRYLQWDENFPFEVKCVRALYYIGKEKSLPYLENLSKNSNEIIREMAKRQLKKLCN